MLHEHTHIHVYRTHTHVHTYRTHTHTIDIKWFLGCCHLPPFPTSPYCLYVTGHRWIWQSTGSLPYTVCMFASLVLRSRECFPLYRTHPTKLVKNISISIVNHMVKSILHEFHWIVIHGDGYIYTCASGRILYSFVLSGLWSNVL